MTRNRPAVPEGIFELTIPITIKLVLERTNDFCSRSISSAGAKILDYKQGMFPYLLFLHIAMGCLGLLLGPIAMATRKRRGLHTQVGIVYYWLMSGVCLTAAVMAIMHWQSSNGFLFVAGFSYVFALRGYLAVKRRKVGWVKQHISGMFGSYIAMVTALLVVNQRNLPVLRELPSVWTWLLPTIIGSPLIAWTQRKWMVRKINNSVYP